MAFLHQLRSTLVIPNGSPIIPLVKTHLISKKLHLERLHYEYHIQRNTNLLIAVLFSSSSVIWKRMTASFQDWKFWCQIFAVYWFLSERILLGEPWKITLPPPPGPKSTNQSAFQHFQGLCSITTTVCPFLLMLVTLPAIFNIPKVQKKWFIKNEKDVLLLFSDPNSMLISPLCLLLIRLRKIVQVSNNPSLYLLGF